MPKDGFHKSADGSVYIPRPVSS